MLALRVDASAACRSIRFPRSELGAWHRGDRRAVDGRKPQSPEQWRGLCPPHSGTRGIHCAAGARYTGAWNKGRADIAMVDPNENVSFCRIRIYPDAAGIISWSPQSLENVTAVQISGLTGCGSRRAPER